MIEHVGTLTAEQWRELEAGEQDPFETWTNDLQWQPKELHTVRRREDGRLIASVGLVVVAVEAGGKAFTVAGVGGVIVSHDHRRQGHLRPTLDAALERAATLGPERAMLFCSYEKAPIYASFGFREIAAPVHAAQPDGERQMPPPAMWRPLREGVTWPEGDVRLPGLPF
jgi:predicted N-acetyltransferase YhbS